MKLGADRKRLIFLGALLLLGAYVVWTNVFSGSDPGSAPATARVPAAASPAVAIPAVGDDAKPTRRRGGQNRASDWSVVYKDPKKVVDPLKVDPTLRLDLLASVQHVEVSSTGQRNIFQFGEATRPAAIDKTPLPNVPKIQMGPKPPPVVAAGGPPPQPVAPPITLKYYGYASPKNNPRRRAFFLDGEDIIVAAEGELIKRRYKLIKIGVNSVTMEDTQFNSQQTLPLAEELPS